MNNMDNGLMQGKKCLVTGSSRGIGYYTALGLAQKGAHVIIVSHNHERCEKAVTKINNAVNREDAARFYVADLSSQDQIHQLAANIKQDYDHLDVLVNNVGGWFAKYQESEDLIEMTFALNHLSYFLLTGLLKELLLASAPARIINVSSDAHKQVDGIQFEDIQFKEKYRVFSSYAQSKLANILFTYELAEQLNGTNVTTNVLHPGLVKSELYRNFGLLGSLVNLIATLFGKTAQEGAETPIYIASSPKLANVSGKYFAEKEPMESSPASYNHEAAKRLWKISEEMTGFEFTLH